MAIGPLKRLFQPRHAVVIGGGVWGRSVIQQCRKIGFNGEIFVVHPSADEIEGIKPARSIADLPVSVDAAFVGVNRKATITVVKQLHELGAGGAVCFASGFREAEEESDGGADLQDMLVEAAGDMPIIGPNCYGFINYLDSFCLWPDQHGGKQVETGVAIVTQSSNIMINMTMQRRGLPIAFASTAGNQAQTSLASLGRAALDDPRVTALGLHIEGIGEGEDFLALAHYAAEKNKPIIALKVGRSELAQQATLSHTASLAGVDAAADALLSKLGIGRVNSLSQFIEALKILHQSAPLKSCKLVSASCSGGEASLIADLAEIQQTNVTFPALTDSQHLRLRAVLGEMVALANPLDYHTYIWGDTKGMADAYTALLEGPCDAGVIIVDFPRLDRCEDEAWQCVIDAATLAFKRVDKPLALLSTLPENMPEHLAEKIFEAGLIPLAGLEEGLAAFSAAAACHFSPASALIYPSHLNNMQLVNEADAKNTLKKFGLDVPQHHVLSKQGDIEALELTYPLVVKTLGLAHKSETGGVRIGIENNETLTQAMAEMGQSHYLIEEMVTDSVAELLLGIVADPVHGFLLTIAAGGIYTELLNDTTHLLLPVSRAEVLDALSMLKISPIFDGYRGKAAINKDAVVDAVMALQDYVLAHKNSCSEIEINPLIVTETRAVAVDALMRIGEKCHD